MYIYIQIYTYVYTYKYTDICIYTYLQGCPVSCRVNSCHVDLRCNRSVSIRAGCQCVSIRAVSIRVMLPFQSVPCQFVPSSIAPQFVPISATFYCTFVRADSCHTLFSNHFVPIRAATSRPSQQAASMYIYIYIYIYACMHIYIYIYI